MTSRLLSANRIRRTASGTVNNPILAMSSDMASSATSMRSASGAIPPAPAICVLSLRLALRDDPRPQPVTLRKAAPMYKILAASICVAATAAAGASAATAQKTSCTAVPAPIKQAIVAHVNSYQHSGIAKAGAVRFSKGWVVAVRLSGAFNGQQASFVVPALSSRSLPQYLGNVSAYFKGLRPYTGSVPQAAQRAVRACVTL